MGEAVLLLLAGVSEDWFGLPAGLRVRDLPTHFGPLALQWKRTPSGAALTLGGKADPPEGFLLGLPPALAATVTVDGMPVPAAAGNVPLPRGTRTVRLAFSPAARRQARNRTRRGRICP